MWIYTVFGFYSVVQNRNKGKEGQLMVRARFREDLDRLREKYLPRLSETKAFKKGSYSDYPFRAYVGKMAFANALWKIAADIDYTNFKNEVGKVQGWDREGVYMKVWSVMKDSEVEKRTTFFEGTWSKDDFKSTTFQRGMESHGFVASVNGRLGTFGTYSTDAPKEHKSLGPVTPRPAGKLPASWVDAVEASKRKEEAEMDAELEAFRGAEDAPGEDFWKRWDAEEGIDAKPTGEPNKCPHCHKPVGFSSWCEHCSRFISSGKLVSE